MEGFFGVHYDALLRFAYLVSGTKGSAEELVQDAFVKMWSVAEGLEEEGMVAYARRVIVNLDRSRWRRLRRAGHAPADVIGADADPVDQLTVRRALTSLTTGQRACIALRYYEDLPIRDIARTLRLSEDAVKKHIRRGLDRLRPILSEEVKRS